MLRLKGKQERKPCGRGVCWACSPRVSPPVLPVQRDQRPKANILVHPKQESLGLLGVMGSMPLTGGDILC